MCRFSIHQMRRSTGGIHMLWMKCFMTTVKHIRIPYRSYGAKKDGAIHMIRCSKAVLGKGGEWLVMWLPDVRKCKAERVGLDWLFDVRSEREPWLTAPPPLVDPFDLMRRREWNGY